ncbi:hypothetical protein P3L10_018715 [Capsicum annuum]
MILGHYSNPTSKHEIFIVLVRKDTSVLAMQVFRELARKKQSSSSASAETLKKEHDYYLENGSAVLEELLALCDGNCRIPIRYSTATEIEKAIKHPENKMELSYGYMVTGSLDKRLVFIRIFPGYYKNYF